MEYYLGNKDNFSAILYYTVTNLYLKESPYNKIFFYNKHILSPQ